MDLTYWTENIYIQFLILSHLLKITFKGLSALETMVIEWKASLQQTAVIDHYFVPIHC